MSARKGPLVAVITVLLLAASATPALAAPPENDDIGSPIVVSSIPYSNSQDTAEATTGPTDPDCSGTGPTVWYEFTADTDVRLQADTFGSDYDTTLYVGTPDGAGGIDLIACNDDAGAGVQSRVRFDAMAGETYLFMAGSFDAGPGGQLAFNLDVATPVVPLTLDVSLDRTARFARDGTATVSGHAACTGADFVEVGVLLTQRVGRFSLMGEGWSSIACSPTERFSIQIHAWNGKFAGGPASASLSAWACGDEGCEDTFVEANVRLRR